MGKGMRAGKKPSKAQGMGGGGMQKQLQQMQAMQRQMEALQAEIEEKALSHTKFDIEIEDGVYYVDAKWLEPVMRTISMDDYSSLQYFQQVLRKSGIIDKLEKMGINEGDTVNILGFEFDYVR